MDVTLSPEQESLKRTVADFARDKIAPVIGELYERSEFPYEIVAGLGKLGLFGLPVPEAYGGVGGDYLSFCLALEELAKVDSSVAVTVEAGVGVGLMPLVRFGTDEQKSQWIPTLASGEMLAAFALTEPGGGSDTAAMTTRARLEGDEWVIYGAKAFITNAGTRITGLVTVAAVTGQREDGKSEISAILVPAGTPGLVIGPEYSKVGWRASDTREVVFDNCRVPAANVLGGVRGRGHAQFLGVLMEGRVALAAAATGLAQGCVDESVRYAKERHAFGRPIAEHQSITFLLADMEARAHTARVAYYDAAARVDAGLPFTKEAAIAKLHASDVAVRNARDATQIHGGYGFMNEFFVARAWRDCKILEIGEGTNEVQKMLISRAMGL